MTKSSTYTAINRLLTVLYRSLPMYLTYATPWTNRGDEQALVTLGHIVEEQKQMADRIGQYILRNYGPTELGEYTIDFLDMHDLSLDYLITKLVEYQKRDIATIERCVADLHDDRHATMLAEETLGAARGHLETLEEIASQLAKTSS